jgi:DNA (cytosine-5)-methyltransferase 1
VARFPPPTHGPGLLPYRTLRDALRGFQDPRPEVIDFTRRRKRYLAMVPPGGNWRDLPEDPAREAMGRAYGGKGGQAGFYRRLAWDEPCPAVTTAPNQIMTSMCHPDETRALSLAECAAVQQFLPDWAFCGGLADRYRQVGNAVPVRLGQLAGEAAANLLDSEEAVGAERPRCRVVDLGSTVRFAKVKRCRLRA